MLEEEKTARGEDIVGGKWNRKSVTEEIKIVLLRVLLWSSGYFYLVKK